MRSVKIKGRTLDLEVPGEVTLFLLIRLLELTHLLRF